MPTGRRAIVDASGMTGWKPIPHLGLLTRWCFGVAT
ncbi:hypothetical protein RB2508 [Rhodopirellula baltica SH 1]|uniref:Uncharacterized protein n=1 Tax=Rhodopirellula baltica (strain DSM 10527 / NCIMB 13988 / SH1) TaxID=243090 RepID=Q7UVP3_RHOBA|nr:hypothetical protein RB2508 [Rhodopirellula baltica SH 1]